MTIGQFAMVLVAEASERGGRKKRCDRLVSVKSVVGEDHSFEARRSP